MFEEFRKRQPAANIDQLPPQEMSIQDMEDLKQQYLDEMKSLINEIQIKDYRNEKIDIQYRRECEIKIDKLKQNFNGMSIEIRKKEKELLQQEQPAYVRTSQRFNFICYDDDDDESSFFIENLMYDNSFPLPPETLKDDSETVIDSNNDYSSSDNDSFYSDDIDYVEASPPNSELIRLEVVEILSQKTLTSTDNEDKVFNPGILVHENLYEVTNRVTPDKNVKKISSSNASLILEDYNPPLSDHELPFHIEILGSGTLLSFLSENEEKISTPGFSFLKEFIHCYRNYLIRTLKLSKSLIFLKARWRFFLALMERTSVITPDYEASRARGFVHRSLELHILSFIMGIEYPNLID
ncbi:hypothetical protein Tco_0558373 [Tanacetum coccineum]